MKLHQSGIYRRWRLQAGDAARLHEPKNGNPDERLVRLIWSRQRIRRDRLQLSDGRSLVVLHPGFENHEAGPDFHQAMIRIDDEPAQSGDVEVDLVPGGWTAHGHAGNPDFANVILRIVWSGTVDPDTSPPVLELRPLIDSPLAELAEDLGRDDSPLPLDQLGRCLSPLATLDGAALTDLLHQAADVRFVARARQLAARARETGWEQSLWEGLMRALGYKNNTWPMQRLGELRSTITAGLDPAPTAERRERTLAALLGCAGFLEINRPRNQPFHRQLWDFWWRDRDALETARLPDTLWSFRGLRPQNHPHRRLALAADWMSRDDLVPQIETWFQTVATPGDDASVHQARRSLTQLLGPRSHPFWTSHYTLDSPAAAQVEKLLGEARATDLAVNVVLPWLWARTNAGERPAHGEKVEALFRHWPAAQDNAVLKLARQRLFGDDRWPVRPVAALQQGLLQVVRDFCEHSNALCEHCEFPRLVRQWAGDSVSGD